MGIGSILSSAYDRVKAAVTDSPPAAPPAPPPAAQPMQFGDGFQPTQNVNGMPVLKNIDFDKLHTEVDDLKMRVVDNAINNGDYATARTLLEAMKNDPIRGPALRDPWSQYKNQSVVDFGGDKSATFKNHADLELTGTQTAELKLKQVNQLETMSKALGRKVDPHNINDVKAYFDKLSTQKPAVSTAEIQKQYGEYTEAFYQHPGGVNWGAKPDVSQRTTPEGLTGMLKDAPADKNGRKVLDCEGHTYLTGAIFGKNPRFDVVYSSTSSHISACVFEKNSNAGFSVDTMQKPPVNSLFVANPKGLALLGPIAKQHELLAKVHHGGGPLGTGIATTVDRDISKVNHANVD